MINSILLALSQPEKGVIAENLAEWAKERVKGGWRMARRFAVLWKEDACFFVCKVYNRIDVVGRWDESIIIPNVALPFIDCGR